MNGLTSLGEATIDERFECRRPTIGVNAPFGAFPLDVARTKSGVSLGFAKETLDFCPGYGSGYFDPREELKRRPGCIEDAAGAAGAGDPADDTSSASISARSSPPKVPAAAFRRSTASR